MNTTTNNKTATIATAQAGIDIVSKASIGIMGATSGLIGLWAVGCMISAMVSTGPVGVAQGWLSAVIGI